MKIVYILIVLLVVASTLGCIGNKQVETKATVDTAQVLSPDATIAPGSEDPFGTDVDVAALDDMLADSAMNITLAESI